MSAHSSVGALVTLSVSAPYTPDGEGHKHTLFEQLPLWHWLLAVQGVPLACFGLQKGDEQ